MPCARASTSCSRTFPPGLKVVYPNDTTPFVRISISEVVKTLLEGIVLVFLVMYLFLQNFRATLIPTIAVPVVLLGTFGVMAALRLHDQHAVDVRPGAGDRPAGGRCDRRGRERRAGHGRGGPVAARRRRARRWARSPARWSAWRWCSRAVFVPVAFSSGTVGAIYRQFSLTIVAAMLLSVFVALTLTPALCATILKPSDAERSRKTGLLRLVQPPLRERRATLRAAACAM